MLDSWLVTSYMSHTTAAHFLHYPKYPVSK